MGGAGADHLGHISIHALREEGDAFRATAHNLTHTFLSTPSARRATHRSRRTHTTASNFYPRPPRGGRHGQDGERCRVVISIHALREEGDTSINRRKREHKDFYPRPPRGGRLMIISSWMLIKGISIHALREEGDSKNRDKISIFKQIIQHSARI